MCTTHKHIDMTSWRHQGTFDKSATKKHNDAKRDRRDNGLTGNRRNVADHVIGLDNLVADGHHFVKSVVRNSGKPPCIILYTDEQLHDIRTLCTTRRTVWGIDKTFNLCDMHVTVTCYKQLTVEHTTTKEPPLFIGPMFIHDNSDFETYMTFLNHLKIKLADSDITDLVIGTDDEYALVKAVTTTFPDSTHVLCTRHLQQNVKTYSDRRRC